MAVKLYTFLWAGVYSGCGKVGNLFDSCDGCNGKFTVESVYGCYATEFQECAFLYMLCHFRHLLISQKHLYYNTVCEVCDREDQDGLFVTDFSFFHIHNLSADDHFTHLTCNTFQCNRFAFEVSSIDNIRVAVPSKSASEIAFLVLAVAKSCFLILLLLLRFLSILFCFFVITSSLFGLIGFLTFCIHFRMTDDILHFLRDLDCRILSVFTLLGFCEFQFYF